MTTYRPPGSDPLAPPVDPTAEGQWVEPQWIDEAEPGAPAVGEVEAEELPEARPRRWRFGPRSLTSRLVTGVVALVVLLVLAIGACTYFSLKSYLVNRLNQQVSAVAAASQQSIQFCENNPNPTATCNLGPGGRYRAATTEWVAVLATDGSVAIPVDSSNASLQAMDLSSKQATAIVAHPAEMRSLTTTDGASLRVTGRVVPASAGNAELVVVSGLSTSEVDRTLHRLILLEWIVGAAAVLLAFAATAGGVELSLRRLRRVTATAHEVAAELSPSGAGLERRVPVEADDTTEVGQLADSMNTLLSAVETQFAARIESEQRMRQFLADASHELRTPLTSIRGYAELARMQRDSADGRDNAGADPANLDRIEAEGTRMSRLIDDLLMLARTDQAAENAAPVQQYIEVDELLEDVVSGARAAYPSRQIHLVAPAGLAVIGDADQLHRAVRNLVNNAAVHTQPDGPIGVRALRDGSDVVIQVADSGPGLSPDDAAHVFERFWRADKARTRARGGSGLGMSIVSSIVGAHGGTVRFDSDVDTGSTVTIRLPSGIG